MEEVEFPQRMFTAGYEPVPDKSIHYFSGRRDMITDVKLALSPAEWQELLDSELGVFLKFHELNFKLCSRMVHYMLCLQLDCKKKYELWSLLGVNPVRFSLNEFHAITGLKCDYIENLEYPEIQYTHEMREMWKLVKVDFDLGPSYTQLMDACTRCSEWEPQQRIWLGYLAIYATFIEAQHWTTSTRGDMSKLLLFPGSIQSYPWGRFAFKVLIDYVKEANRKLMDGKNYQIGGFAEVLNIWIYWTVGIVSSNLGTVSRK